jgi:Ca2+-binding RTX toxin-like protein
MNPSLAMNLGSLQGTYSDSFVTLDLMKEAGIWLYIPGPDQEVIVPGNSPIFDANGWPTELPVVNGVEQTLIVNVFYTEVVPAGKYIIEWTGTGTVQPYQDYEVIGPNKILFDYEANYAGGQSDGITVLISSTDPNNTGDYVRDIKVYDQKFEDLVNAGERYNPEWFQKIDDFRVLRTHEWGSTNNTELVDWNPNQQSADRALWGQNETGGPFEVLVDIANQTQSDLWVTIPHMASDAFMLAAANYIKDNLDKDLRVYVEYTNEYWTEGFKQNQYIIDKGLEKFGAGTPNSNAQFYGARASEMAQIFYNVFGDESPRLIPTITVDDAFFATGEANLVLNTPAYVAQGGLSPLQAGFKFLATDGYLTWFTPDPSTEEMIDDWMTDADGGYGRAAAFLIDQLNSSLLPNWQLGKTLADANGLGFGVYEGGSLLINSTDGVNAVQKYTDFNLRFSQSEALKRVYEAELAAWKATGEGPFAVYSDVGRPGFYGDYGIWNGPDFTPEPRANAVTAFNSANAPWWAGDNRPASTFENGTYDAGTLGADRLTGSALADRLYGLAGNDTIVGSAGADRLYGGAGRDGIDYSKSSAAVVVNLATATATGGFATGDQLFNFEGITGSNYGDQLTGNAGGNALIGGAGKDVLIGGDGADRLTGGAARDVLTGGAQNDVFDFDLRTETGKLGSTRDVITDFVHGSDRIDLRTIDAVSQQSGNQTFDFIGGARFHKVAGELHVVVRDGYRIVEGDVNGDGKADFQIQVNGNVRLTADDFVL